MQKIVFFSFFCFSSVAWAIGPGQVLFPSKKNPLNITPGQITSLKILLPFSLTPPPGVQKEQAWKDWEIELSRHAQSNVGEVGSILVFSSPPIQVKPTSDNRAYEVFFKTVPWLPDGLYDLKLKIDSVSYSSEKAMYSGKASFLEEIEIKKLDEFSFEFINTGKAREVIVEFLFEDANYGLLAKVNKKKQAFQIVTWAGNYPENHNSYKRLYFMKISFFEKAGGANVVAVDFELQKKIEKDVFIQTDVPFTRKPMSPHGLKVDFSFKSTGIFWNLDRNNSAVGSRIEHIWLFDDSIVAQVAVFDQLGVPHFAQLREPFVIDKNKHRWHCSVIVPGSEIGNDLRILIFVFFLILLWNKHRKCYR